MNKGLCCLVTILAVQLYGWAALSKSVGRRNIESVLFSFIHLLRQTG